MGEPEEEGESTNEHPSFQLGPLEKGDDLIDRLIEYNPAFRATLEKRLKEPTVSAADAMRRL